MDGDGHDEPEPIFIHSHLFTSSLDKTGSRSSHSMVDESKTPQPIFTHNDFYSTPSDTKMTLPPIVYILHPLPPF